MTAEVALFVAAAAIGELLPFPKPRGRDLSISVAVVAAFALLGHPVLHVLLMAAGGWTMAAALRVSQGRSLPMANLALAVVGAFAFAGSVRLASALPLGELSSGTELAAVAAIWFVILLGLPAVEALEVVARRRRAFAATFARAIRDGAGGGVALAASASLGAIVHGVFGAWSVPLVLLPLLAARIGLVRYVEVRVTYDQTVRAMSRLPEELGTVGRGHGVRVGDLAGAAARELGLSETEITDIERAAHLHELGQIRADLGQPLADRTVALAGASILREAGSLDTVADLVERHRDPYRPDTRDHRPGLPIGARVVRTVCEFDRAAVSSAPGSGAGWSAIERLRRHDREHDPDVVDALVRVLEGQGRLRPVGGAPVPASAV